MQTTEEKLATPKGKILVVDDMDINRRLLEAMLTPLGHEVFLAGNGLECLTEVEKHKPDLILLDVMMPQMDGFETVAKLKGNPATKAIPVVMITALTEIHERIKALEHGADDFLSKPVNDLELRARINSLLNVKAYHDHLKNHQLELEAEVERRTEELREAFATIKRASLETIYRLARAAEFRDDDTGEHIIRIGHFSAAIAKQMGLSSEDVENIFYAAPMHDVGKIATPDAILRKPGKLDENEWQIMRQHSKQGALILEGSDSELLRVAEVIALTHHEKWDGSGYPRGLAKEEIPIAGRITAIADVFDALTSKRPYKEPFPVEKSFAIIKEGKGSHFDPEAVEAFFAITEKILEIKEQFGNK
ncbi:MAG: two-component system response regulator [Desulfobulbaceae bacterium]|nr:two-component system response regulator [Desulfobulbaceae bacterium]